MVGGAGLAIATISAIDRLILNAYLTIATFACHVPIYIFYNTSYLSTLRLSFPLLHLQVSFTT
jgi:hypothetical protein